MAWGHNVCQRVRELQCSLQFLVSVMMETILQKLRFVDGV